jgi:hypothetical protein
LAFTTYGKKYPFFSKDPKNAIKYIRFLHPKEKKKYGHTSGTINWMLAHEDFCPLNIYITCRIF